MQTARHLNILGTRGIPAAHGGFETFAEYLARYLVGRGWSVNVYCQSEGGDMPDAHRDTWEGIERTHFRSTLSGPAGTMQFDLKAIRHVLGEPGIDLVLGYNTALFCGLQRLRGRRILMNMDGIEWRRSKWGPLAKAWFFLNELVGANITSVAIADHPQIAAHTRRRSLRPVVMIPYGADPIAAADAAPLIERGLTPERYFVSIARLEPENSILEIVRAAKALPQDVTCVVLGSLDPENLYHRALREAASGNVLFAGAIYDKKVVGALRLHATGYLHGHQVGGTNPSLVEALGAGSPVIAHDNPFNRWTAGPEQAYFGSVEDCIRHMRRLADDPQAVATARTAARARHAELFEWDTVLEQYEQVLEEALT